MYIIRLLQVRKYLFNLLVELCIYHILQKIYTYSKPSEFSNPPSSWNDLQFFYSDNGRTDNISEHNDHPFILNIFLTMMPILDCDYKCIEIYKLKNLY